MKTLVIGGGGREHALALALSRDPNVTEVHAAPGNPGMAACATLHPVDPMDGPAVAALATGLGVDLVVVGPEAPLVGGVADTVREAGVACFGPSAAAARLEGSKAFAKDVMAAAEVPTAMARVCDTDEEVADALDAFGAPYVVKDDGLAAGKGVVVTEDRDEAVAHAKGCVRVVIEEYLDGPEVSLFAITDGETVYPLQPAQDFKRALDADQGPNTGGMGAYTPLPWAPDDLVEDVRRRVLEPTVVEMAHRGAPFSGLLYAGLALTKRGLRVVEFNARFGDPETQALLQRMDSPLGVLLLAAAEGRLHEVDPPTWRGGAAVTVVVAAAGYPESPRKGDVITGVAAADALEGVDVIHAGTATAGDDLVTAGGRVLAVTAVGDSVADARARAYEGVDLIEIDGAHHRTDIAAGV
ncbi:phosphoribosylamine--glycine ligase [Nocardioides sp. HDW12B]|uniref:phosphoribosylamine--glycine ligase n=1 Tax=Nocardioides sp. HDW12B TaxID=2714939 RepID=UPI001409258D|nr:phosphoribosylamine--glycine ligase [Nocardioides sp. HDW12B]QIK67699.1 phosphoribosylamine--glycine ligase [Nocardioides sp. HDW12B]